MNEILNRFATQLKTHPYMTGITIAGIAIIFGLATISFPPIHLFTIPTLGIIGTIGLTYGVIALSGTLIGGITGILGSTLIAESSSDISEITIVLKEQGKVHNAHPMYSGKSNIKPAWIEAMRTTTDAKFNKANKEGKTYDYQKIESKLIKTLKNNLQPTNEKGETDQAAQDFHNDLTNHTNFSTRIYMRNNTWVNNFFGIEGTEIKRDGPAINNIKGKYFTIKIYRDKNVFINPNVPEPILPRI